MATNQRSSGAVRSRKNRLTLEHLEARHLLANLAGYWNASDLDASLSDGQVIASWTDSTSGIVASGEGSPTLVKGVLNGQSVVRFGPTGDGDAFLVAAADSPMSAAGDFSIATVFATSQAQGEPSAPLYVEDFNGFTAPGGNFNGGQFESGLAVAFSGNLPDWSKSGAGTVHAVDRANVFSVGIVNPRDFAVMIWQDNVITQTSALAANDAGQAYSVNFDGSPAVYQAGVQQTSAVDGLLIEVLRSDNSVLDSFVYLPGAWAGNTTFTPAGFEYVGDGTGDVRIRIGPSNFNSARFGGAIDNLTVGKASPGAPAAAAAEGPGAWFDHAGLIDANAAAGSADWGLSLTGEGQIAAGVGAPQATVFSTDLGLLDGQPHVVILTKSGDTLSLSVDGVVDTLSGVSTATRATLGMAFGRLLDNRNFFSGDIAEIRIYDDALTTGEVGALNQQLLTTYRNTPPVAVDDPDFEMNEDSLLSVIVNDGLLKNDTDAEDNTLSAILVEGPGDGTLELNADGSFTYQPREHFFGADSFTYIANDGENDSNVATVTINVLPVADAPSTLPDGYLIAPDDLTTIAAGQGVLANDFHPDGASFTALLTDDVDNGSLTLNADGSFSYTPNLGFVGTDSFSYKADDGSLQSAATVVELVVSAQPIVISEFMASNNGTLSTRTRTTAADSFNGGQVFFDWIELQNLATVAIDLGGLHLTDRDSKLTKWEIPAGTIIPASGYLVVMASGLDITDPALDENGLLHTNFKLGAKGSFLAITGADGAIVHQYAPQYPNQFTDVSYGITADPIAGYFLSPTPGGPNGASVDTDGPIVSDVTENPGLLADNVDLVVTARVQQRSAAIQNVDLVYRVMFGAETTIAMRDDGQGADLFSGDGLYSAVIPQSAASPGEMLRWKVIATDQQNQETVQPLFLDRSGQGQSPEYFGTMIADPAVVSQLSVLNWFVGSPSAANTTSGTRSSLFFSGEFYDNVFTRIRGASSAGVVKKSYKFDFNVGDKFRYAADQPRVEEINVNTTFQDKAYIRPQLTFESFAAAGVIASDGLTWRVEQNGSFFSVASFIEQVDADLLSKNGLDPEGALYKMFNGITSSTAGVEKKTRRNENNSDLQALVGGISASNPNREEYLFDNIDIPALINYATAGIISQDFDRWAKNFYLYRDTNGSGEWLQIPHDKDLTFGNRFFDDEISGDGFAFEVQTGLPAAQQRAHPFQAAAEHACCSIPNWMIDALVTNPRTREMYLRRLRTLMDEQLQPPGTPEGELRFESRLDTLAAQIAPDAAKDLAKWGAIYGTVRDFPTAIDLIKTNYLDERRVYLYETHGIDNLSGGGGETRLLVSEGDAATALVPTPGNGGDLLGNTWTQKPEDFVESSDWLSGSSGVGYDRNPDFLPLIRLDLLPQMDPDSSAATPNVSDTALIRIPFTVDGADLADPSFDTLTLRMKYDDAFVAYINGVEVARSDNAPAVPVWNSAATANHPEALATVFENFSIDLTALQASSGALVADSANVLAIRGLNNPASGPGTSSDMLILPQLVFSEDSLPAGNAGSVGIPHEQAASATINFGTPNEDASEDPGEIVFNPISGNQDEEYISLVNPGPDAVDISGWELTGGVQFTFRPGTVIPAGGTLYVSPDVSVFRARATGPGGGQSLFVQGGYSGHLSNLGETVNLVDAQGVQIATFSTPFTPSDAQKFLRITELNYNPPGSGDSTEFIEFRNISSGAEEVTLDLTGVQITDGPSDPFDFSGSDVTSLAAGEFVLVVKNLAAFSAAYDTTGLNIAGEFAGSLSNSGETIKVEDADDSTILQFKYENGNGLDEADWHPETDGDGFSLVIASETGPVGQWDLGVGWRSSALLGGSPGVADPTPARSDISGDGITDRRDVTQLVRNFGRSGDSHRALGDVNGDRATTLIDLAMLQADLGSVTQAASPAPAASFAASALVTQPRDVALVDLSLDDQLIRRNSNRRWVVSRRASQTDTTHVASLIYQARKSEGRVLRASRSMAKRPALMRGIFFRCCIAELPVSDQDMHPSNRST